MLSMDTPSIGTGGVRRSGGLLLRHPEGHNIDKMSPPKHMNFAKSSSITIMTKITASMLCLIFYDEMNTQFEKHLNFLAEIITRSKIVNLDVLQLCNFYLFKISCTKNRFSTGLDKNSPKSIFNCPRRLVLSCILLSTKYLLDETYTFKVWNKITGLPIDELNKIEKTCLNTLEFKMHVNDELFTDWRGLLNEIVRKNSPVVSMIDKSGKSTTTDYTNSANVSDNDSNVNSQLLSPPTSPTIPGLTQHFNTDTMASSQFDCFKRAHSNAMKLQTFKKFCATIVPTTSIISNTKVENNLEIKDQLAQLLDKFVTRNSNEFSINIKFVHATNNKKRTRDEPSTEFECLKRSRV